MPVFRVFGYSVILGHEPPLPTVTPSPQLPACAADAYVRPPDYHLLHPSPQPTCESGPRHTWQGNCTLQAPTWAGGREDKAGQGLATDTWREIEKRQTSVSATNGLSGSCWEWWMELNMRANTGQSSRLLHFNSHFALLLPTPPPPLARRITCVSSASSKMLGTMRRNPLC